MPPAVVLLAAVRRSARRALGALLTIFGVGTIAACGGDTAAPGGALDPAQTFWGVALNHPAVLLSTAAPYDTVQLVATPIGVTGAPLAAAHDSVVTTYELVDPTDTNVTVSPTGLLRARHPDALAIVRVRATVGGVTHADSVLVAVSDDAQPPRFARLALAITPNDTVFTMAFRFPPTLSAQALDPSGLPIAGAVFAFRSSDTLALVAFGGDPASRMLFASRLPGRRVWVSVTATVYGVTLSDSLPVTVTWPYSATVFARFDTPAGGTPVGFFSPDTVIVARGGTVTWQFDFSGGAYQGTPPPIDVAFDDPSAAGPPTDDYFAQYCGLANEGGDIAAITFDSTGQAPCTSIRSRTFREAGTYPYRSRRYGTRGAVVVKP